MNRTQAAAHHIANARDYLMDHDDAWTKFKFNSDGQACMAGAVLVGGALMSDIATIVAWDILNEAAYRLFPDRARIKSSGAINVNDHADTTFNDVVAVFDEALALCKERV